MVDHSRHSLGIRGEDLAVKALEAQGYQIITRNAHCGRTGEIDIVAMEGKTLVIVEVRSRSTDQYGTPEESITWSKKRRLLQLGLIYTQREHWYGPWRIDIVSIRVNNRSQPDIRIYRSAVEADKR